MYKRNPEYLKTQEGYLENFQSQAGILAKPTPLVTPASNVYLKPKSYHNYLIYIFSNCEIIRKNSFKIVIINDSSVKYD